MDYIGGMLNPIGKMPKHTRKMNFVMVLLEKANGILMETIGISVMGYFGLLLLLFFAGERDYEIREASYWFWGALSGIRNHRTYFKLHKT